MTQASYMQTRVSDLRHAIPAEYDPAKAHAYYIKTRQLKGRQPGAAKPVAVTRPGAKVVPTTQPKKTVAKPAAKKSTKQLKTEANAAVAALQAKLTKLKNVLAELTKQAQARSGVTTATATAKKSAAKPKPQTAAEKKAAADAHAYYEAHKSKTKASTPAEQEKQLHAQIKQVEAQIKAIKAQLAEAAKKIVGTKSKAKTAS
jgi:hypothetical protein